MKYAHIGDSTDNNMTIGINGKPTRTFVAFATAADRKEFQEETWKETGGMRNVIFCSRKDVEKFYGKDFIVTLDGIMTKNEYEEYLLRY